MVHCEVDTQYPTESHEELYSLNPHYLTMYIGYPVDVSSSQVALVVA